MSVDRCVCFSVTFERMKEYHDQTGCDLIELERVFCCGRGCGLCPPYIKKMLQTGHVSFNPEPPQNNV